MEEFLYYDYGEKGLPTFILLDTSIYFKNINNIIYFSSGNITSCFNAGKTSEAFESYEYLNNYYYYPITGVEETNALKITSSSQINSDFFINTIGLDSEKWDLGYININDEYGLPKIKYNY